MALVFTFKGVDTFVEQPRARVQATLEGTPDELAFAIIEISLPVASLSGELSEEIGARALAAARQLLNESVLQDWVGQEVQKLPVATYPTKAELLP